MTNKFIEKLQNKPENTKKIILWVTVIIVGLVLFFLWIINAKRSIQEFWKEDFFTNFNVSGFKEKMENLPKVEIPKIDEEKERENQNQINNNLNNGLNNGE